MKTSVKLMIVAATITTVTILSCKKERMSPTPTQGTTQNLSALFEQKAAPKQTFTIDANQYQTITGAKGTILNIQPGSFKNLSGQVATGNVTIELREIYSKADMIFSKAPTVSNEKLLVSGGELFIQAFQNGSSLYLASSNSISAMVPAINPGPMKEFYVNWSSWQGEEWQSLNWQSPEAFNDSIILIDDTTNFDSTNYVYPTYYYFNIDGLNWINCDYFYDSPGPFTDIEVVVPPAFSGANCEVFVSFDGLNSVAGLADYDVNHSFEAYSNFPQGLNVHIVAIANINGQYYSAFVPATLSANFSTNITLTATTMSQIIADVNALP